MSDYWLCRAGVRLRTQVDRRWPKRDTASDGWIGNADHAATASDHNPCWTCKRDRYGVVRAIDIDATLDSKRAWSPDATVLAEQIRRAMKRGDDRIAYVIAQGMIASMTYLDGAWRPYDGDNPHDHHIHVSFNPSGDFDGDPFHLPVLDRRRSRLTARIHQIVDRLGDLRAELARARRARRQL